jgi:hypothetical protein
VRSDSLPAAVRPEIRSWGSASLPARKRWIASKLVDMHLEDKAKWAAFIREHDARESQDFLVGLGNGIWITALLTFATYWLVQGVLRGTFPR